MSYSKPTEKELKRWSEQFKSDIVRYANRLETYDIARMDAHVQDLIVLLLAEWTSNKTPTVCIPLSEFKRRLHIERQNVKYIQSLCMKALAQDAISVTFPNGDFLCTHLISRIRVVNGYVVGEAMPEFMPIFSKLRNSYTQFMSTTFINIKPMYAKNLFRLFCRYYRGSFTMKIDDFKKNMGFPESYKSSHMRIAINDAVKVLQEQKLFKNIHAESIEGPGRGRPIVAYKFSFEPDVNLPSGSVLHDNDKNRDALLPKCPNCNGPLRWYRSEDGKEFIGHVNYQDCTCKPKTFNNLDDLRAVIDHVHQRKHTDDANRIRQQERTASVINANYDENIHVPDFGAILPKKIEDVDLPDIHNIKK